MVRAATVNVYYYCAVIGWYGVGPRVQLATGNDQLNSFPVLCFFVRFNLNSALVSTLYDPIIPINTT